MTAFSWVCTTCGHHTTITGPNYASGQLGLVCDVTAKDMAVLVSAQLIECPNEGCKAQDFRVFANHAGWEKSSYERSVSRNRPRDPIGVGTFTFCPVSPQPLSVHAPAWISQDYNESYLIRDLSPKASATLARRALQGMVRDFFQVPKMRSLHHELEAIEDKCEAELYAAMMDVKSIGNIGAHPERDVSLMVDVEPGEPQALLDLIHLLDQEWYVARADKAARVAKVRALGADKANARAGVLPSESRTSLLTGPAS